MKYFKIKLIALCGLMVLAAASLAPVMADESACPQWEVSCKNNLCYCDGTLRDGYCYYGNWPLSIMTNEPNGLWRVIL